MDLTLTETLKIIRDSDEVLKRDADHELLSAVRKLAAWGIAKADEILEGGLDPFASEARAVLVAVADAAAGKGGTQALVVAHGDLLRVLGKRN